MEHRDIVSPSLLKRLRDNFRNSDISPAGLELEDFVEFVPVAEKPAVEKPFIERYKPQLESKGATDSVSHLEFDEADDALFIAASQVFEQQALLSGDPLAVKVDSYTDGVSDELLLQASQIFELEQLKRSVSCELQQFVPAHNQVTTTVPAATIPVSTRFAPPCSSSVIKEIKESRVPAKTKANTNWSTSVWNEWATYRQGVITTEETITGFPLHANIVAMESNAIGYWLQRFVLEVRKSNKQNYCPDSLYQLVCGLQRALRAGDRDINFFEQFEFSQFRDVLDGELKRLNSTGKYILKRKVDVITEEMEDTLWEKGLLGDHSPQVLSDTMIYLCSLLFALRSGEEHRRLRFNPCQIKLVEQPGRLPYLWYKEDKSKTNQAGLYQKNQTPKEVIHHANESNPQRCLVQLFKLYNSLCPSQCPDNAFYLAPLPYPAKDCWFKKVPLGHSKLAGVIPRLMKNASIPGYFTNHSLRATCTTRLYDGQVDEASIMERTGHRSIEGVRAYKRSTDKLKELSSNVLNRTDSKKTKMESTTVDMDVYASGENSKPTLECTSEDTKSKPVTSQSNNSASYPKIDFSSAVNCTVNFTFTHLKNTD